MIDDCNINDLAKNQVSAVFHSHAIHRSVLPKFSELCMESPRLCPSEGNKHAGRDVTKNICRWVLGAIAEYPAQPADFDSTATVVRGPQSASKVICMYQVLNWSATAVRSPAVDERTRYIRGFYIQFIMEIMSTAGLR